MFKPYLCMRKQFLLLVKGLLTAAGCVLTCVFSIRNILETRSFENFQVLFELEFDVLSRSNYLFHISSS